MKESELVTKLLSLEKDKRVLRVTKKDLKYSISLHKDPTLSSEAIRIFTDNSLPRPLISLPTKYWEEDPSTKDERLDKIHLTDIFFSYEAVTESERSLHIIQFCYSIE